MAMNREVMQKKENEESDYRIGFPRGNAMIMILITVSRM
jgi:hypothetical protein